MVRSQARRAFTLIELLTVIAIIAILTAILFPVAGTVREQARASDCMTKLHQLWVSANVYRQDEGGFPPVLLAYAEAGKQDATGRCVTTGLPWQPPLDAVNNCVVNADDTRAGFLYREQIKDLNIFRCPDNQRKNKAEPVVAYFPPKPVDWPAGASYIGDVLASQGCATAGALGTQVCNPATGKPYYFYAIDSYDIGPAIDPATGAQINQSDGSIGYSVHYTPDWTGVLGATDLPYQLKYENPPDDKTMFTLCSWHQAIAKSGSAPAISMGGSAKKMNIAQVLSKSAVLYAK
jgi:prepilin-type N-terminal cleavage/methylation domain-containing protein